MDIASRIKKTNDQRVVMAFTLLNIMKHSEGVSIQIRSAVAASMLDMLNKHMIPEDRELIKMINDGIDELCEEARVNYGVENLRMGLSNSIEVAEEQMERIKEGEGILNGINFNDINLN